MDKYLIRKASRDDIAFLAEAVIAAEKGISNKCNYLTLFNISEEEAKKLIISMFEENVVGCEFSISNYLITEYESAPVATFGAWIECFNGCLPSSILKSNLISCTFNEESMEFLKTKMAMVIDLIAERSPMTLQLEYLYVSKNHRGNNLAHDLMDKLEEMAKLQYPALKKAQVQLFSSNINALKLFLRQGYRVVKTYKSDNNEILNYLPSNEKLIMEKEFN